jgi:hypothetical protein
MVPNFRMLYIPRAIVSCVFWTFLCLGEQWTGGKGRYLYFVNYSMVSESVNRDTFYAFLMCLTLCFNLLHVSTKVATRVW